MLIKVPLFLKFSLIYDTFNTTFSSNTEEYCSYTIITAHLNTTVQTRDCIYIRQKHTLLTMDYRPLSKIDIFIFTS